MFTSVKVNQAISEEMISNLFTCAVEGGSNYWCKKIRPLDKTKKLPYYEYMFNGFEATIDEPIDNKGQLVYTVTDENIKEACQLIAEKYPKHFKDIIEDNADADTGDIFLQLCLFKEVVFG